MNCDRIARWYRPLEYLVFGRALEKRRFEYLGRVGEVRKALILGDGDGRFTAEFVKRNPLVLVDSVELSARMLALAQARLRRFKLNSERVRFLQADARTIDLEGEYDLIVTHFFLDCFAGEELRSLVGCVSARCVPRGRWLVSEFSLPAAGVRRVAAAALIWVMYLFFWVATGLRVNRLPDYAPVLAANGFRIVRQSSAAGGLLVSELWERTSVRDAS
jgi:SAM-dependent methyltransferase